MMKSLYQYFRKESPLPSPNGPLSREVPAGAISEANKEVTKVLKDSEDKDGGKSRGTGSRGTHQRYTPKDKATIGNYAAMHGTSAALRHFKSKFPDLKYTTICEWRKAIVAKTRKDHEVVTELEERKRGRPGMLPEDVLTHVMKYIRAIRDAGGIINTAIMIAAGLGIVKNWFIGV